MNRESKPWQALFFATGLAFTTLLHAQELTLQFPNFKATDTKSPAVNALPPETSPSGAMADADATLLTQSFQLLEQGQLDAALEKANAAAQLDPRNPTVYELRGSINAEKKLWDAAEKDYQTVLKIDASNTSAKFNLTELEFRQKRYDDARFGFFTLEKEDGISDLASYKVFLCDLFGGHENTAAKELEAFNDVGSNPSYYYANAAWFLVHNKNDEAKSWIQSAIQIYSPLKNQMYASSLIDLGYLVAPPAQPTANH